MPHATQGATRSARNKNKYLHKVKIIYQVNIVSCNCFNQKGFCIYKPAINPLLSGIKLYKKKSFKDSNRLKLKSEPLCVG